MDTQQSMMFEKPSLSRFRLPPGWPNFALSIRQPWAWLILHAGKDIENRNWKTRYRGPVLIHAGKAWGRAEREAREMVMLEMGIDIPANLELGGIVGKVDIVDCVDESDSRWFFGPEGFVLRSPEPLPLVECRGELGFFKPANTEDRRSSAKSGKDL